MYAFFALGHLCCLALVPRLLKPGYATATRAHQLSSSAQVMSIVHCLIILPTAIGAVIAGHSGDPVFEFYKWQEVFGSLTVAFFSYDITFMIFFSKMKTSELIGYMLHHIAGGGSVAMGLYVHMFAHFGFVALVIELSTPLVNLRFLRLVKYGKESRQTPFGHKLEATMLIVFFACRLLLLPWVLYQLLKHRERAVEASPFLWNAGFTAVAILLLLSAFWWGKMLRNFLKYNRGKIATTKQD